mmetsp:Transcript_24407/g.27885  ORF Transcript_24407/g.27885 Transcript_24407/m.27885 type:complete len:361 (+) Transcript_24407:149-1231(+)
MFSSFSAGNNSCCRLASRYIRRSSRSLLWNQQQQQQNHQVRQKITFTMNSVTTTRQRRTSNLLLSSRFSGIVKTKNSNIGLLKKESNYFSTTGKETVKTGGTAATINVGKETATKATIVNSSSSSSSEGGGWWTSAEFWGAAGAVAAWGMSGAAIYDSTVQGPEVISLTMTPVLIVYSSLFARWAWIVKPRNLSLMWCHVANVVAQTNQLRRALEYKINNGEQEQVNELMKQVGVLGGITAGAIIGGPTARIALSEANLGFVSNIAAADAGPFTVHFWAPMSKVFISGASMLDLNRPTDQISLPQYAALTLTGFFFTRYALLVTPINYTLCAVNVALFLSSFWHFGRKIKADYVDDKDKK